jgi:N-acetylglutamate synthase-like GNAT family acetyltransferase
MTDPVTIRPARPEDAATIRRMVRGAGLDPTSLHWPNFLVAENEGRVIGVGQVKPYRGSRELGSLVVLKSYRGQGVGSMIVRALIERESGDLYLLSRDRLEAYYARFGFRRVGWRDLRGVVRRKYTFVQVFRVLFGVRVIAMYRPHPPSP